MRIGQQIRDVEKSLVLRHDGALAGESEFPETIGVVNGVLE
jgi:hypothetical protein